MSTPESGQPNTSHLTEPKGEAATGREATSKPTPGPWIATAYGTVMPLGANYLVASCVGKSGTYRNYKANARLIAAAPDLLAASKRALAVLKTLGYSTSKGKPTVLDALSSAIAAATGSQP